MKFQEVDMVFGSVGTETTLPSEAGLFEVQEKLPSSPKMEVTLLPL